MTQCSLIGVTNVSKKSAASFSKVEASQVGKSRSQICDPYINFKVVHLMYQKNSRTPKKSLFIKTGDLPDNLLGYNVWRNGT